MNGSLIYQQTISLTCAKAPSQVGAPIMAYDFQLSPPENVEIDGFSNDAGGRYNIAASASESIGFGTVGVASVLILTPDNDIKIQLVNNVALIGTISTSSPTITSPSSLQGLQIGQPISGVGIPANTTIIALTSTTITMSHDATANTTGVAISAVATTQPIYVNGGQTSVLNLDFTGLILTNPNASGPATGKYFFMGI